MPKNASSISVNSGSDLRYGGHVKFNWELANSDKNKTKNGGPNILVEAWQNSSKVWDSASGANTDFPLPDTTKPDSWTSGAAHCIGKLFGYDDKGTEYLAQCEFDVVA